MISQTDYENKFHGSKQNAANFPHAQFTYEYWLVFYLAKHDEIINNMHFKLLTIF